MKSGEEAGFVVAIIGVVEYINNKNIGIYALKI